MERLDAPKMDRLARDSYAASKQGGFIVRKL